MNCIETKKNIEALLDGELDDEQKDAVEHHLWICATCRELRQQTRSLSSLLQMSNVDLPSDGLDKRVMRSFQKHHSSHQSWRQIIFGTFAVPKPAFAVLTITALAGLWLAFQIGKISSSTVLMAAPAVVTNAIPVQMPAETTIQTVLIEVPVVKEKIIKRTVYVRTRENFKNQKNKFADSKGNNSPLFSSTVANNGYFTDVSLKGFLPAAEINAKIIKEVKEDEK